MPEAYKRFIKKGRLPKWDDTGKRWVDLGPRESVKYAQTLIDKKVKLINVYDECCDILHFSATHMAILGGVLPENKSNSNGQVRIKIGSSDDIPIATQKKMINLCVELATGLGRALCQATEEKQRRAEK